MSLYCLWASRHLFIHYLLCRPNYSTQLVFHSFLCWWNNYNKNLGQSPWYFSRIWYKDSVWMYTPHFISFPSCTKHYNYILTNYNTTLFQLFLVGQFECTYNICYFAVLDLLELCFVTLIYKFLENFLSVGFNLQYWYGSWKSVNFILPSFLIITGWTLQIIFFRIEK